MKLWMYQAMNLMGQVMGPRPWDDDETAKRAAARPILGEHARDHEAHVDGLVREVVLGRAARRARVREREHGRRDDEPVARPRPLSALVIASTNKASAKPL